MRKSRVKETSGRPCETKGREISLQKPSTEREPLGPFALTKPPQPYHSWKQTQVVKVPRYSFRIQTRLLFVVPLQGVTAAFLAKPFAYQRANKNYRDDLHIPPSLLWGG